MTAVYFDAPTGDRERRDALYHGDIFVLTPWGSTLEFARFTRSMIEDAFKGLDPETAQYSMSVEDYAAVLGRLKPQFIHHPESKVHIQRILGEMGCDPEETYFEVPKLRSSTSDGYLTAGIAYAWHPHRDTWYSAPPCQINWWMPVYALESGNAMAFHPRYFSKPVANTSADYNYYIWNQKHRGSHIQSFTGKDPRPLPAASEPVDPQPELRLVVPVGGLILFSGAQLHSSVENLTGKTRFSVDFRTVNEADLVAKRGAPNVDSACTGTVLREFKSAAELSDLSDEIIGLYEDGTERAGSLVFDAPDERIPRS